MSVHWLNSIARTPRGAPTFEDATVVVAAVATAAASIIAAPGLGGVAGAGLARLMVAIAAVDARRFIIPDEFSAAALALGLADAAIRQPDAIGAAFAGATLHAGAAHRQRDHPAAVRPVPRASDLDRLAWREDGAADFFGEGPRLAHGWVEGMAAARHRSGGSVRFDRLGNRMSGSNHRRCRGRTGMDKFARLICGALVLAMSATAATAADAVVDTATIASYGDPDTALKRIGPQARRGNARAEALLGYMYEHGLGVPQSWPAAVDYYLLAAEQGDSTGQYLLGLMYDKGFGVSRDVVQAYKWLNLAASHGPKNNREYFLRLRDAVASKMTRAQLDLGQQLALEWSMTRVGR